MEGLSEDRSEIPVDIEYEGDVRLVTVVKDLLDLNFRRQSSQSCFARQVSGLPPKIRLK